MGYSHYWFQEHGAIEEPVWRRICNDVEKLIDACQVRLSATVNGSAPPIVDAERSLCIVCPKTIFISARQQADHMMKWCAQSWQ